MRVALLHGFAGDPGIWSDTLAAWRAAGHAAELVPIMLPGHGAPVRPTWGANLASIATTEIVVGYSLGARIALGLLANGRVRRAVLISVNPGIPVP